MAQSRAHAAAAISHEAYADALTAFIAAKEQARAEHRLAYLFWECTLRCNLSCRHCGSDCVKDDTSATRELGTDAICRELSAIARRYDPRTITFAIIGGEPLLRHDIEKAGAHAAGLGFAWGIMTSR
jgi:MoaA/NifB/PqqE/SkfB family radical SAM enzyme